MVREILKWCDKKSDELLEADDNVAVECTKAFGLGALEGLIDSFALIGAVTIVSGIVKTVKEKNK